MNLGDRVTLKSGGPNMTVTSVGQNGTVQCTWFPKMDSDTPSQSYFPVEALKKNG